MTLHSTLDKKCTMAYVYCRVYEKMMEKMQEVGSTITGFKKTLAQWAKKKGLQGNLNIQKKYIHVHVYVYIVYASTYLSLLQ